MEINYGEDGPFYSNLNEENPSRLAIERLEQGAIYIYMCG